MSEEKTTLVDRLAGHAAGVSYESLSEEAIHQIKRLVLDDIGCYLGAWRLGINRPLIDLVCGLGGAPESTIWGDGRKAPAALASLAIGAVSSHLEYDSHADMVAPALAVGEQRHRDGRAVIAALAVGLDVAAAVKQLLAAEIEAHRLHWPGQLAVYPAAAVACHLAGAPAAQTAAALALAGCLAPVAPFEAFTQGAGVKDLYGGWGAMVGVLAAQLGPLGFGGPATVFEGVRSVGQAWLHRLPTAQDLDGALAAMEAGGAIGFKGFPACTCAHPALTALEALLAAHPGLRAEEIARVEVETYAYAVDLSGQSVAQTPVAARVSIPYLCAARLIDGRLGPEQTEEPRLSDPRIRELAARVSVSLLPGADTSLRRRTRPARVTVTLRDGRRLAAATEEPKWRGASPATDRELEEKFVELVGDLLPAARRDALVRAIWELEAVADTADLIAYLI